MYSYKSVEIRRRPSSEGGLPGDSEEGLLVLRRPSWRDERRGEREGERERERDRERVRESERETYSGGLAS